MGPQSRERFVPEPAAITAHEHVETPAAPGAAHAVTARRTAHDLPGDPTFAIPPTMMETTVAVERENVDAVRIASGGRGQARERPAERLPSVPAPAVPGT